MARDKDFGATNDPRTCLWCGVRLTQIIEHRGPWITTTRTASACHQAPMYEGLDRWNDRPAFRCEKCDREQDMRVTGYAEKTPTGRYGEQGDGLFCRTRCGYQFGRAMAQHGRRLMPSEAIESGR
jgi:hypothetical protein